MIWNGLVSIIVVGAVAVVVCRTGYDILHLVDDFLDSLDGFLKPSHLTVEQLGPIPTSGLYV